MKHLPEKITKLAEIIKQNGGRAMLVGGCVRDELMKIEPKDFDVEIYGIEPEKLKEILEDFGKVDAVGEAFTVYKSEMIWTFLYRAEKEKSHAVIKVLSSKATRICRLKKRKTSGFYDKRNSQRYSDRRNHRHFRWARRYRK
jgi:tRNA nucleotidyltransferase/poly(A) polymerase